jgi:PASTA domain
MGAVARVFGGVLAAAALVAGLAAPAQGTVPERLPTIEFTPADGPVGTKVTVTGGSCQAVEPIVDEEGSPTTIIYPARIAVFWDGVEVVRLPEQDTFGYQGTFSVPDDARVGGHKVWVQCVETGDESPTLEFTVTAPEPELVVVPRLVGRRVEDVPVLLRDNDLVLGEVRGSGDVVASQNPVAGSRVTPGSAVDVTVRRREGPQPRLVRVPQLVGRSISAASEALGKDLRLGQVTGTGDVVERQNPVAGTMVRPGSAVNISLTSRPPRELVAVPDLVNKSLDEARSIVPVARLVLANDTGGEGTIASQSPSPGTLVPPGSEITIELATTESLSLIERSARFAAGVLVILGAVWLLLHRFRKRGPAWVRQHIEVRASEEQPGVRIELREPRGGQVPTVALSFEARRGAGRVVVEEYADE